MRRTKTRPRPRCPISATAVLIVLLLVFLGVVGYWHLRSVPWVNLQQTRGTLIHLTQKVEALDEKMTEALQGLDTLKQEQAAIRSRIDALEAVAGQGSAPQQDIETLKQGQNALQTHLVSLESRLDELMTLRDELIAVRDTLQKLETNSSPPQGESSLNPTSLGVPLYAQAHTLSCEAASVAMVAAFFGVPLSEQEVLEALPRHENPNLGYRGDIDGSPGGLSDYGVHAAPIHEILTARGLRASVVEGGLEDIRSALNAGHPLIAWITYNLWEQTPVAMELSDSSTVKMVPYEHVVVIEGYTDDGLWALDPYDDEREFLSWADFERSWGYLDYMALEVKGAVR